MDQFDEILTFGDDGNGDDFMVIKYGCPREKEICSFAMFLQKCVTANELMSI